MTRIVQEEQDGKDTWVVIEYQVHLTIKWFINFTSNELRTSVTPSKLRVNSILENSNLGTQIATNITSKMIMAWLKKKDT